MPRAGYGGIRSLEAVVGSQQERHLVGDPQLIQVLQERHQSRVRVAQRVTSDATARAARVMPRVADDASPPGQGRRRLQTPPELPHLFQAEVVDLGGPGEIRVLEVGLLMQVDRAVRIRQTVIQPRSPRLAAGVTDGRHGGVVRATVDGLVDAGSPR